MWQHVIGPAGSSVCLGVRKPSGQVVQVHLTRGPTPPQPPHTPNISADNKSQQHKPHLEPLTRLNTQHTQLEPISRSNTPLSPSLPAPLQCTATREIASATRIPKISAGVSSDLSLRFGTTSQNSTSQNSISPSVAAASPKRITPKNSMPAGRGEDRSVLESKRLLAQVCVGCQKVPICCTAVGWQKV